MSGHTDSTDTTDRAGEHTATPRRRISTRALVLGGILLCLVLAGIVSFYASASPDGLEAVAERHGFADAAGRHASGGSPFADYAVKGIQDARLSGGLAGVVGVLVVGLIAFVLFRLLARRNPRD